MLNYVEQSSAPLHASLVNVQGGVFVAYEHIFCER